MLFEIDPQPLAEELTALGGVPLVVRAFRSLGLPVAIREHVHIKQGERGYDEATYVESLVVLNAVGGECVEDREPHLEEIRECAEVPFVPGEKSEHKLTEPLSRLAGWGFGFASGRAVCLRAVLPPGILRC